MNKLILLLTLVAVSFSGDFFKGMENPNGKPFTLSIRTRIVDYSYMQSGETNSLDAQYSVNSFIFGNGIDNDNKNDTRLDIGFTMPIANMLTIDGNIYSNKYTIGINQLLRVNQLSRLYVTCHLPLYKLWEN